jgi:hypothetical protein
MSTAWNVDVPKISWKTLTSRSVGLLAISHQAKQVTRSTKGQNEPRVTTEQDDEAG